MYGQRRWTVPSPPSIKLVSTTICKIVTEMWLVVSPRSCAVRYPSRGRQQCIMEPPLLLSTLVLIFLYIDYEGGPCYNTRRMTVTRCSSQSKHECSPCSARSGVTIEIKRVAFHPYDIHAHTSYSQRKYLGSN